MSVTTPTYINPLTDFGFKFIFGRDADKTFIISFLNALGVGEKPITEVWFMDKENNGESKDDRALIYDLHCQLEDGSRIIVEMQNRYQTHFNDRAVYYVAADIYAQGMKGKEWNYKLTPVCGVFLMNFEWKDDNEQQLREDVCLYNIETKKVFSDKMRMIFLKIPMMDKDAEDCRTTFERWLYLLKNMDKMDMIPQTFTKEPVFERLEKVARYAVLSDRQKKAYNESLKVYRDNYAIAETERNEGIAEGIAIGRAEGRAEAIAEQLQIAKEMGLPEDVISRLFGKK